MAQARQDTAAFSGMIDWGLRLVLMLALGLVSHERRERLCEERAATELLARVPQAASRQACICATCAGQPA